MAHEVRTRELYANGVIHTMDGRSTVTDAVLVENGVFTATGAEARERAAGADVVDLGGRTMVPGLIDAHTHVETAAISTSEWLDVRAVSADELLRRVKERADALPAGRWIVGQATFTQSFSLPGRHELDAVAPENPVVLRCSMHVFSANTMALDRAGILSMPYPPTGVTVFRDEHGELNGHLREAFHLFPIDLPDPEVVAGYIRDELRERFTRFGVTGVHEIPMSKQGMRAFQLLDQSGRLDARVALFPAVGPGLQPLMDDIEQLAALGFASGFGNDMLWLGGAKFFLDGVYDDAYWPARDIDHPSRWGSPTHLYSEVRRAIVVANRAGIQTMFHAIGTGAQQMVIDAATEARALAGGRLDLRVRIEHAFNEKPPTAEMITQMRESGLIPVPNGVFIHVYDDQVGSFPFRTLIDEGFTPPGTSDNSGTQPFSCNPWWGMTRMLTRRNRNGVEVAPEQRIGVHDALRAYTEFGAHAGHRENRQGVIRPGALADFAVLTADPFDLPPEEVETIESTLTVVGGRTVWDAR